MPLWLYGQCGQAMQAMQKPGKTALCKAVMEVTCLAVGAVLGLLCPYIETLVHTVFCRIARPPLAVKAACFTCPVLYMTCG